MDHSGRICFRALRSLRDRLADIPSEAATDPRHRNDYVQRYWQIRDAIDAAEPESAEERRWRFAYVRLCEDEIDLHDMPGRVTRATWSQWNNGMKAELLSNKLYAELIEAASSDSLVGVRSLLNGAERPTGA